jgi:hypothetical protein
MRSFNISGPCYPAFDYQLEPLTRRPDALGLIKERRYLSISGPRQSGKTSLIRALCDAVNAEGWGRAIVLSCEVTSQRGVLTELADVENVLVGSWCDELAATFPYVAWPTSAEIDAAAPGMRFGRALLRFSQASDRPLVFILDEVDAVARGPFVQLLSSVRSRYGKGPGLAPHSVVLAGMRNLREHDRFLGGDGSGSPFNIVHELAVTNFSRAEIAALYAQHTAETGQVFTDAAVDLVREQTRGQPWLVNAIARTCVMELVPGAATPVEAAHVEESIRRLEASNPIHLTSLAARLTEPRVLRVVAPMVVGDAPDVSPDDLRYALELGLVVREDGDVLRPANPIYARALLKLATQQKRTALASWEPTWLGPDGRIDVVRLRENFLSFWKLQRGMMRDFTDYPEAVPHFGLMTYLDRVANGGGQVDREFAVGGGRLDLLLRHRDLRLPIEVKVHRDHRANPVPEGLVQLDRYCAGLEVETGWLVVFDQRTGATGTRLDCEEVVTEGGRRVSVIRA